MQRDWANLLHAGAQKSVAHRCADHDGTEDEVTAKRHGGLRERDGEIPQPAAQVSFDCCWPTQEKRGQLFQG